MKGAIAELCASTIRVPMRKRATSMGTSHHLLLLQKNENNSPTIPKRPAAVRATLIMPIAIFLRYAAIETFARFSCLHRRSLVLVSSPMLNQAKLERQTSTVVTVLE